MSRQLWIPARWRPAAFSDWMCNDNDPGWSEYYVYVFSSRLKGGERETLQDDADAKWVFTPSDQSARDEARVFALGSAQIE